MTEPFFCRTLRLLPLVLCTAANAAPCASTELNTQELQAVCTVPAAPTPRPLRIQAHFLGSHDDSVVSLKPPTLNGVPMPCGAGSKTESTYEDGEVTLDCRLLAPAAGEPRPLTVPLALHHVQLDRVELLAE
jgi:hypothetical protein